MLSRIDPPALLIPLRRIHHHVTDDIRAIERGLVIEEGWEPDQVLALEGCVSTRSDLEIVGELAREGKL